MEMTVKHIDKLLTRNIRQEIAIGSLMAFLKTKGLHEEAIKFGKVYVNAVSKDEIVEMGNKILAEVDTEVKEEKNDTTGSVKK